MLLCWISAPRQTEFVAFQPVTLRTLRGAARENAVREETLIAIVTNATAMITQP